MLLQPNKGSERRRNRGRREINEHFNLDMIEVDPPCAINYRFIRDMTYLLCNLLYFTYNLLRYNKT